MTKKSTFNWHDKLEQNPETGLIRFRSVTSKKEVSFPAFITAFNDNYTIAFGGETVFGRNDPVKHYQSTSRAIQASFDILAIDGNHAKKNFNNYTALIQMCYPVYNEPIGSSNNARTIKAPPIWRIKYSNYISSPDGTGLLGVIQGISFTPKFEAGHFITKDNKLLPVSYTLSFNFQPLHEVPLGYNQAGNFVTKNFPYGFNAGKNTSTPMKLKP